MHHHTPSWCERINAHRAPPPEPAPAPPPAPAPVVPTPAPKPFFTPRQIPAEHFCERCGTRMYDHNCKIVCPTCGYKRDCSDP